MKTHQRLAITGLLAAALSGCVVAPAGPYRGQAGVVVAPAGVIVPPGVVYVAPGYPMPAPGYGWSHHPRQGWGWHHPNNGWHRGWH